MIDFADLIHVLHFVLIEFEHLKQQESGFSLILALGIRTSNLFECRAMFKDTVAYSIDVETDRMVLCNL